MKTILSSTVQRVSLAVSVVLVCLLISAVAAAQDRVITQDEVNAVAERMYCPVCENIPLDDCGTATCNQWKEEIRDLLAQGKTAQQIVDDFVARYGDQVVGIPYNPILRALAYILPIAGVLAALGIGYATFKRWGSAPRKHKTDESDDVSDTDMNADVDDYRAQLERDL